MPLIHIETNQPLHDNTLLEEVSQTVAALLGKPESYVMVKYTENPKMLFAGDTQPLAYLQLKSLGLPEGETGHFSQTLCNMMQTLFDIAPDRTYIEFSSPPRHYWGWNNTTF